VVVVEAVVVVVVVVVVVMVVVRLESASRCGESRARATALGG
jgi:hypothetical protein